MDKHISKQLFRSAGVLTPEGVLVHKGDAIDLDAVPLPCVVKPCFGGSSLGISIVHERSALSAQMSKMKEEGLIDYRKNAFEVL